MKKTKGKSTGTCGTQRPKVLHELIKHKTKVLWLPGTLTNTLVSYSGSEFSCTNKVLKQTVTVMTNDAKHALYAIVKHRSDVCVSFLFFPDLVGSVHSQWDCHWTPRSQ